LRFSTRDFSTLLKINLNTYHHYEKNRHTIPKDILLRLNEAIKKINLLGKRKAIFEARKEISLKNELLFLRGLRLQLQLSTRELTKLNGNQVNNLHNLERGFTSSSKEFREKIINILKSVAKKKNLSWQQLLNNLIKFKRREKNRWINASKYEKIVDLRIPRGGGVDFEKEIYTSLKKQNFFDDIIINPVLANEEYTSRFEADIYAIKNFGNGLHYDFLFECKSRSNRNSIGTKGMIGFARELFALKTILGIKEAIIVTDIKCSFHLEKNINALGVHLLYKENLGDFFHGTQSLDRKIQTTNIF